MRPPSARVQQDARLKVEVAASHSASRRTYIEGILRANEELSGEALKQEIAEQMALRERLRILPTASSSRAGFQAMTLR